MPRPRQQPETDLLLVYPQWQGAGPIPGLRSSALMLASAVSGSRRRREIDVPPGHPLQKEHGIHGRGELLHQLRAARSVLDAEDAARVFAVGGDCGIEVAVLSHLAARYEGALAVVWLDAHPDLNTPESSPSGHFHGMPLRVLLADGDPEFTALVEQPLEASRIVLAGMRAPDPPERAFIEERRLTVLSPEALDQGPDALLRWLRATGLERAYVHLDLDVCEPRDVPGVACPTPHGVPVSTLIGLLDALAGSVDVVGAGVTEGLFDGPSVPSEILPIIERLARL